METVVLCWWENIAGNLVFSDERLTLETSAFLLYGGQFTFSIQLLTLNYPKK